MDGEKQAKGREGIAEGKARNFLISLYNSTDHLRVSRRKSTGVIEQFSEVIRTISKENKSTPNKLNLLLHVCDLKGQSFVALYCLALVHQGCLFSLINIQSQLFCCFSFSYQPTALKQQLCNPTMLAKLKITRPFFPARRTLVHKH